MIYFKKITLLIISLCIAVTVISQKLFNLEVVLNSKIKITKISLISYYPYQKYDCIASKDSNGFKFKGVVK
ncbi:MAG: hypothetical protein RIR31_760, partial [Bacteroidota bacterium]